jgi:hypothetical protein
MSVNRERPHVLVLPEDQANREIVNGFIKNTSVDQRRIQVVKNLGGWKRVCEEFENVYVPKLNENQNSHVVLLIDFDGRPERRSQVEHLIPEDLRDRSFVIGVLSQPEKLKADTRLTFEEIGRELEEDCPRKPNGIWNHELLKHNAAEVDRIWKTLGPILLPSKADIRSAQERSIRAAESIDSGDVGRGQQ